jgi:ribosomal protein S18 acetylase RimI-like enzyme
MSISTRPFAGESDYEQLRTMLVDSARLNLHAPYCTIGDLDWWRWTAPDPDQMEKVQIWFDGDRVIGFVWPDELSADVIVHPHHEVALDEMLEWAEQYARSQTSPGVAELQFETWAYSKHDAQCAALANRRYQRGEPAYRMRAQSLKGSFPAPQLPEGYVARDMQNATADDIEKRVDVHRATFAPSRMTVAKHTAIMTAPTYRPDLDLAIVAPDGSFAAFTIVWFDEVNQIGVFEPVGTHPDHQRRGLGRAIIAEGLRRLSDLNATTAYINTGASSPAANLLYAAAGFQAVDENISWTKAL